MRPTKAYILRVDTLLSHEYAAIAAESCSNVGLQYEYFEGVMNISPRRAWDFTGINYKTNLQRYDGVIDNPTCCSAGHAAIWKKIAEGTEAAVILEHDAIMLHNPNLDLPDDRIVVLGYKTKDPSRYDHITAGPPQHFTELRAHEGAHAYALTPKAARFLINEIECRGILGCVDNAYFILGQRTTELPLTIMDPTPAIGWVRKSTLWDEAADRNYQFIQSFRENYK